MNNNNNNNNQNRRNDNYDNRRNNNQRNQRNNNNSHNDSMNSIPPGDKLAGMMTEKEKNWVTNVQMLQLQIDDPYNMDFYYTVRCFFFTSSCVVLIQKINLFVSF